MSKTTDRQIDLSGKNNPATGASKNMFAVYAKEANAEHPFASIVVGERPEPKVPNDAVTPFTLVVPQADLEDLNRRIDQTAGRTRRRWTTGPRAPRSPPSAPS